MRKDAEPKPDASRGHYERTCRNRQGRRKQRKAATRAAGWQPGQSQYEGCIQRRNQGHPATRLAPVQTGTAPECSNAADDEYAGECDGGVMAEGVGFHAAVPSLGVE